MSSPSEDLASKLLQEKKNHGSPLLGRGWTPSEASTSCPASVQSLASACTSTSEADVEQQQLFQLSQKPFPNYGVAKPPEGPPDADPEGDFGGFPHRRKISAKGLAGLSSEVSQHPGWAFAALAVLPFSLFVCALWLGLVNNTSMALSWGQSAILLATMKIPVTLCLCFASAPWPVSRRYWGTLCLFSSCCGGAVGVYGNYHYMRSYDMYSLGAWYSDVWPAEHPVAWKDAVAVEFSAGAGLALDKGSGYQADKMYCVAPVMSLSNPGREVGFWAIGTDCCEGDGKFHCGDAMSSAALGGLVVEQGNDFETGSERHIFEQAAHQAAAQHNLKVLSPLVFLRWSRDLRHDMELLWQKAMGLAMYSASAYLCCVLALFLALAFWCMAVGYHRAARTSEQV
mmetsp:Transcript_66032/g.157893  ORF Transcript_66032/g.157893 Transcript_66032/m.157893 type:complete len:398 (-) Transcript_66032:20-1213(-)